MVRGRVRLLIMARGLVEIRVEIWIRRVRIRDGFGLGFALQYVLILLAGKCPMIRWSRV